jgi:hypothetical protein
MEAVDGMAGGAMTTNTRWPWAGLVATLALLLTGCGGGGGQFELPPGGAFDSVASNRVLLVVEADNQCEAQGNCSPTPAATPIPGGATVACDLGHGNTRGLSIYRLGVGGLLLDDPRKPGTPDDAEQVVGTADNPRRVVIHPNDPSLVYVATDERIQIFRLAAGATRCIGQTKSDQEIDPNVTKPLDPVDLAIDPTIGNGVLYVAARGASRIDAYTIAGDGTVPDAPTSCVVGLGSAQFSAVVPLTNDFVATGGQDAIEVYRRVDGQFPPPSPALSTIPTPSPSPGFACVGALFASQPVSSIGSALVTDMSFAPSAAAPLGQLFIGEEASLRIFTFPIDTAGVIADTDSSQTARAGLYQRMLPYARGTDSVIVYASVFDQGRIDAFRLENGLLPHESFSHTAEDPFTLPVGLAIDSSAANILYVAQGGIGRVDGFAIASDGSLGNVPTTSTRQILGPRGNVLETFPDDLAIVNLPLPPPP